MNEQALFKFECTKEPNDALSAVERDNEVVSAVLSGDIDYVACLCLVAATAINKSERELATAKLEQVQV